MIFFVNLHNCKGNFVFANNQGCLLSRDDMRLRSNPMNLIRVMPTKGDKL